NNLIQIPAVNKFRGRFLEKSNPFLRMNNDLAMNGGRPSKSKMAALIPRLREAIKADPLVQSLTGKHLYFSFNGRRNIVFPDIFAGKLAIVPTRDEVFRFRILVDREDPANILLVFFDQVSRTYYFCHSTPLGELWSEFKLNEPDGPKERQ